MYGNNMMFQQQQQPARQPMQMQATMPNYWNSTTLPQYSIVQVNGEGGANAFQMGPNSKTLLLDETAPIVWFVQTDGAGYKTVTPYSITPYQPAPPVDLNSLEARLTSLEEKVNAQSNIAANKSTKQQQRNGNGSTSTEAQKCTQYYEQSATSLAKYDNAESKLQQVNEYGAQRWQ